MNPTPTEIELRLLDHIDSLSAALEHADGDTAADILEESLAVERRLETSRENTWSVWFASLNPPMQRGA